MNRTPARASGTSLIELAIAVAILTSIFSIIYMVAAGTSSAFKEDNDEAAVHDDARRAVEEMARELRMADAATLTISTYRGASRVEFSLPQQGPNDTIVWSAPVQYRFEPPGKGKQATGLKGRVVRAQGAELRSLVQGVDADSLEFKRLGNRIVIRLALKGDQQTGNSKPAVVETTISLRNRSAK